MKKIIDEHGRVFGKVSIIDFVVVLVVLLIGAGLFVKYNVLDMTKKSGNTTAFTYTVTVYGVRDYTVNALKPGDVLYEKNSGGNPVGTITDVKVADAKKVSETIDGRLVLGNFIGCKDVSLTVTANGTIDNGRYLVNKTYEINANSSRIFNTKFCTFEATITGIS